MVPAIKPIVAGTLATLLAGAIVGNSRLEEHTDGQHPMHQSLTTQLIPALIRQIAVPASVGFFFNTLFNAVDTWWGGRISTQALAALSLSLPVFFLIIATGSGLGAGTTALIGTALGKGDRQKAERFAAQGLSFGLAISALLTLAGLAAARPLFATLGASGEYLAISLAYFFIGDRVMTLLGVERLIQGASPFVQRRGMLSDG